MTKDETTPNNNIDPIELRNAFGRFATGVTIVTADDGDDKVAFTANSFCSVSLDPALLLICLRNEARALPILKKAGAFAVHFLSEGQSDIAWKCASPDALDRMDHFDCEEGKTPYLAETLARFDCTLDEVLSGGDHSIFIGKIIDLEVGGDEGPLTFYRGKMNILKSADAEE